MTTIRQPYRPAIIGLLLVCVCGPAVLADESERFLDGLRRFGLFQLAERYCQDKLADPNLPTVRRAEFVIGLSRSLADRAVNAPPDRREQLWQKAQAVTERFVHSHPNSPQLPLVRLQSALERLARGELARQEAAVVRDERLLLDEARIELRAAVRQLRELSVSVAEKLRRQHQIARPSPDSLTVHELATLAKNVNFQLARALRNQGQCYPPDSTDRAHSLTQAVELLEPLTELDAVDPLAWKGRIDQIVCYRLLNDYSAATRKIDAMSAQNSPPGVALRIRAEKIRLALATNRLSEAVELSKLGRGRSSELDYALLQTYLAAWQAAGTDNNAKEVARWQAKTNDTVRLIEQAHGPYWARRAEMLLAGSVRATPGNSDLSMLVRAAESSYRSGQLDEALAAYDRAISLAVEQGDKTGAFEQAYVAATIEHKRGRHKQALNRYREVALAMPKQPKAPDAFLLAIHHAVQIARSKKPPNAFDRYAAMLEQYVKTWPQSANIDTVRRRLGRLCQHRKEWQKAIDVYRSISPDSPNYYDVVNAVTQCYRAQMRQSKDIAASAASWFESVIVGPDGRLPEEWSPASRLAALQAARFWLDHSPPDYGRAERIVSAALSGSPDAPPEWKSNAHAVLVSTLAGQGRHKDAAATLDLLADARDKLTPNARRTLDRVRAESLATSGRTREAIAEYATLSKTYPRDARIQENYAKLLATEPSRTSLELSLDKWRELGKNSKQGTERWFRAKYAVASLHYRLGDREQAAKILGLLQVLHPELGGPKMEPKFMELLNRCQ